MLLFIAKVFGDTRGTRNSLLMDRRVEKESDATSVVSISAADSDAARDTYATAIARYLNGLEIEFDWEDRKSVEIVYTFPSSIIGETWKAYFSMPKDLRLLPTFFFTWGQRRRDFEAHECGCVDIDR